MVESFAQEFRQDYEQRTANRPSSHDPEIPSESETAVTSEVRPAASQTPVDAGHKTTSAPTPVAPPNISGVGGNPVGLPDLSSQAAQMQFSQLLMSMGLAGMGMPNMGMNIPMGLAAAMGIPPQMLPLVMGAHMDPLMAAAFNHQVSQGLPNPSVGQNSPASSGGPAPVMNDSMFAAQQKILQQQQLSQQQKRARTRITDEQLKILRQYFDINNSPTEEQLMEMSEKSGLPLKVIKHWFRNTLFKERQRNKDSPYNFNNPPSTFLNLEEYEKTGETKILPMDQESKSTPNLVQIDEKVNHNFEQDTNCYSMIEKKDQSIKSIPSKIKREEASSDEEAVKMMTKGIRNSTPNVAASDCMVPEPPPTSTPQQAANSLRDSFEYAKSFSMSPHSESSMSSISTNDTGSQHASQSQAPLYGLPPFASGGLSSSLHPVQMAMDAAQRSQNRDTGSGNSRDHSSPGSGPGKRANRTRFTDYQIKVLQEFFESNAYPKDDDLEYLSKLLNLSPRVIVVWFQNARQKARKVYENQPAVPEDESTPGKFQRTPGLNYQCKKCMQVFQRYYELIKHQKSACFKDENPLAAQLKVAQEARQGSASPGSVSVGASNSSNTPVPAPEKTVTPVPPPAPQTPTSGAFRCEKCNHVFPRFDLWREHQMVHVMNPNLFPSYPPTTPFGILQFEGQNAQSPILNNSFQNLMASSTPTGSNCASQQQQQQNLKRKSIPEDEDSLESFSGQGSQTGSIGNSDQPRDKRLRTTILPEQLDYLYQKYQLESNPSRKMLENIAKEVGLKKRVVQVWFQNTRARERKGQFRAHQQVIHKRCPFCRALFKARSALESHLATRHADQYTKGDINIDALPDGEPDEPQDDIQNSLPPEMRKYLENTHFLKKYMEDIGAVQSLSNFEGNNLHGTVQELLKRSHGEAPLDLSKPVDLSRSLSFGNGFDSRSEDESGSDSDLDGADDMSGPNSPAPGSTSSSVTSPSALGGNGHSRSASNQANANKRFRTQMTTVQLKVMKSIFADYKTPSMTECENLGRDIGLPKRVIQVWFQNARAKEKKAKLACAKAFGQEMPETPPKPIEECKVCNVRYNLKFSTSMQDHLFSKKHLENLKNHIDSIKTRGIENPDDSIDFPGASMIVMPHQAFLRETKFPMIDGKSS